ncbi:MAG: hypothetical protein HN341_10620 [Verrucomicrobia bacterium]|jgi:hypothetical protein|nr:hypothetical protein [Verrucomicrobiota bacterium]
MHSLLFDVLKELIKAWRGGSTRVRAAITTSVILLMAAVVVFLVGRFLPHVRFVTEGIAGVLGAVGVGLALIMFAYQKSNDEVKRERHIEEVERRAQEHPKEPQAAWELARVKLESYLDRNLSQVRAIFWLTVFVMLVGFALIGVGIVLIYSDPDALQPSLLSSISGVIVSFIGATFLSLYRSTMTQASDYVSILERINAVGMSVQILETLGEQTGGLREQTTAEIAKQLLVLYTQDRKA